MIEFPRFVCGLLAAISLAASVHAQEFGGTRNPELMEITLSDGSTTHFVIGQYAWGELLAEMGQLRGEAASRDREIADQLFAARDTIPPGMLFEAARRYASFDQEQAVYVFLLARARTLYDALRCVDSTATEGIPVITDMAGNEVVALMNINEEGGGAARTERMQRALQRLLDSGETFNSTFSPWWICSASDSAFFAAVNAATMPQDEWLKQEVVWPTVQEQVRRNIRENQALLAITMGTRDLANSDE
ncbi:hypothetical protein [Hyphobacterium sp.]|uniref:hypothetical protein n=1 Tax=Hyphobacterium sp. TaxID=2004662 RepID=UPI003B52DF65